MENRSVAITTLDDESYRTLGLATLLCIRTTVKARLALERGEKVSTYDLFVRSMHELNCSPQEMSAISGLLQNAREAASSPKAAQAGTSSRNRGEGSPALAMTDELSDATLAATAGILAMYTESFQEAS